MPRCAGQAYHQSHQDARQAILTQPPQTRRVRNVNQNEDSNTSLEQIPEDETIDGESEFYIHELTEDWASIKHIDEKTFQNKNVILNK